jgi:8-oxo-dGTP pyrophosphatase MutT (NUDIX family)
MSKTTKLVKLLTWTLRHGANLLNIPIKNDGYISLNDILKNNKFNFCNKNDIMNIIKNDWNNIYNYKIINDNIYIKSNFGHSLKLPDLCLDLNLPFIIYTSDTIEYKLDINTIFVKNISNLKVIKKYIYFIDTSNYKFYIDNSTDTEFEIRNINELFLNATNSLILQFQDININNIWCCGFVVLDETKSNTIVVKNLKNKYSFPKGCKENKEYMIETSFRELFEETGLKFTDIKFNVNIILTEKQKLNMPEVKYFVGYTQNKSIKFNKRELNDSQWLSISDSLNILNNNRIEILKQALEY